MRRVDGGAGEVFPLGPQLPYGRLVPPGEGIYVWCGTFYVRAKIVETVYVHADPRPEVASIWRSVFLDGEERVTEGDLSGTSIVNQFPYVDWPIGHAAYFGVEGFLTLEEARLAYGSFPKRGKYRRARNYLSRTTRFVDATWRRNGHEPRSWPERRSFYRRIYV